MTRELRTVLEFCLDQAPGLPVARRVELYRGLAEFCGDRELAAKFRNLADELDSADHRCREFAFSFVNPRKKI